MNRTSGPNDRFVCKFCDERLTERGAEYSCRCRAFSERIDTSGEVSLCVRHADRVHIISKALVKARKVYHEESRHVYPYFQVGCPVCLQTVPLRIQKQQTEETCAHLVVDHNDRHGAVIDFRFENKTASVHVVDLLCQVIPGL